MKSKTLFAVAFLACATLAGAAPDEGALGKSKGYPRGEQSQVYEEFYRVGSFSAMDDIFPYCTIPPSATPLRLKKSATEPAFEYHSDGKTLTVEDYLNRQRVTGLLVLKDGEIVLERYQYDRKPEQRFVSASMAETIVALGIGIALAEGKIASLDDPAAKYAPAIAGSSYGETSLKHLLRMSSGVKFTEEYNGLDDIARWTDAVRTQGTVRAVKLFNRRDAEPGAEFHYGGSQTVVLALALRGATGKSLCEWIAEKLWQPMGAQSKATWLVASDGVELAQGNFNATLRDFARLGWLLANDGKLGDKQIIPRDYLLQATRAEYQPRAFRPGVMKNNHSTHYGYGYQTWILSSAKPRFALLGIFGQAIYVDPKLKLVMAQTAVTKKASDVDATRERERFWRGVVARYGSW